MSWRTEDDAKLLTEFLSWLDQQDGLDFTDNAAIARRFLAERNSPKATEDLQGASS